IRHADELSTTKVPTSAKRGAHSSEVAPPAEKTAISGFNATAVSRPITSYSLPFTVTFFPTDLSEATGRSSSNAISNSSITRQISCPTKPVIPTIANFILIQIIFLNYGGQRYDIPGHSFFL